MYLLASIKSYRYKRAGHLRIMMTVSLENVRFIYSRAFLRVLRIPASNVNHGLGITTPCAPCAAHANQKGNLAYWSCNCLTKLTHNLFESRLC